MMIAGLAGAITIDIWSIVDAVRLAKVNNLAWRDSNKIGINLQLSPYFLSVKTYSTSEITTGLSLKISL
jgi:hypothetical protein